MRFTDYTRPRTAFVLAVLAVPAFAYGAMQIGRAFATASTQHTALSLSAVPIAVVMAALAVELIAIGVISSRLRYVRSGRVDAVHRVDPDTGGLWMDVFSDLLATIDALTDAQLGALQSRYDGAEDLAAIHRAEARAWHLGEWVYRLVTPGEGGGPTRAHATLASLADESSGAYIAALAVAVRDLIGLAEFEALTGPWIAEGLPLPGGPAMEHLTMEISVPSGLPDQWTVMEHAVLEGDGTAASAAQMAQSLAEHAAELEHTAGVPRWRLRVWIGLGADRSEPADGVYEYNEADVDDLAAVTA